VWDLVVVVGVSGEGGAGGGGGGGGCEGMVAAEEWLAGLRRSIGAALLVCVGCVGVCVWVGGGGVWWWWWGGGEGERVSGRVSLSLSLCVCVCVCAACACVCVYRPLCFVHEVGARQERTHT
jgi:hypothetical protein